MPSMVLPGRGDVHVNRPLKQISIAFIQKREAFIADRVFPGIPVNHKSDSYWEYPMDEWFRDEAAPRAAGAESEGGGYRLTTSTYDAIPYSFHKDVEDQVRENADDEIDPERGATLYVTQKYLLRRERDWAAKFFAGGIWSGGDVDGVAGAPGAGQFRQWNDGLSTPTLDIKAAKRTVLEKTGFMPNKLVLGRAVFDTLIEHPDVIGRFDRGQTSGVAVATRQTLAALFELDEVLVMDAVYNSAAQGQTKSMAFVGGKKALLTYSNPTPAKEMPSAGYTFLWTGRYGQRSDGTDRPAGGGAGAGDGFRIRKFRMEPNQSDRVEIDFAFDHKKVASDLGYFFDTAVA